VTHTKLSTIMVINYKNN